MSQASAQSSWMSGPEESEECTHRTGMETEAQRVEKTCPKLAERERPWDARLQTSSAVSFQPAYPERVDPCTRS